MARKRPVSPNQTVLWAYQALAPEWGSPALSNPSQGSGSRSRVVASASDCADEGESWTEVQDAGSAVARSVSALVYAYSGSDLWSVAARGCRQPAIGPTPCPERGSYGWPRVTPGLGEWCSCLGTHWAQTAVGRRCQPDTAGQVMIDT
jgi:hypothetical protein